MTIFRRWHQTRAFSHIDDVAPVIARSPLSGAMNQVFNVGADTPYTVSNLRGSRGRLRGAVNVKHLPARNEVVHAFSDHSKLSRIFGKTTPVSLKDGIARMADWVKSRGPARPVPVQNVEIREKLPPSWA